MARPLLPSLLLHGMAFAIGLGGAAFLSQKQPSPPPSLTEAQTKAGHRRDRSTMRLSSPSSFRAAYEDLMRRPMSKDDRSRCMQELWKEWAASDPAGMLAFLEKIRVWPEDLRTRYLLSDHPDLLLAFALRQGCAGSIHGLYGSDSYTVSRLLAALPEEQKGTEIRRLEEHVARSLGKQGIPQEAPGPAYRSGVAQAFLEAGRIDEFFDTFPQVEDPELMRNLAMKFGEELSREKRDDKLFALFLRLPEDYRKHAASQLTEYHGSAMKFPEVRQKHMRWLEKFATAGCVDEAAAGVFHLFRDDDGTPSGAEIAAWVSRFPEDGSWQPITEALVLMWVHQGTSEVATELGKLPDGPVREALANEAYAQIQTHTRIARNAQGDQALRERWLGLFTTPEAKERFEKRFSSEEDAVDPFAAPGDPFAAPD